MDVAKPCSIQTLELCCRAALWEGSKAEGVQNPFPWEQSALWESADFEGLSAWCWSRICPRALLAVRVSGWQDEGWDLPSPTQEPLPQWGAQDPCPPPALSHAGKWPVPGGWFSFSPWQSCYSELRWLCVGFGLLAFLFCLFKIQGSLPFLLRSLSPSPSTAFFWGCGSWNLQGPVALYTALNILRLRNT